MQVVREGVMMKGWASVGMCLCEWACVCASGHVSVRCKFDSNSTQNTSPALQVLCLVVSVTQSFETTSVHLYSKHKQTKALDFS